MLAAADARGIRISRGAMPDAIVLLQMGVMNHNAASWPAPVLAAAGARVVRISRGAVFNVIVFTAESRLHLFDVMAARLGHGHSRIGSVELINEH